MLKDEKSGATKLVVLLCSADGQCKNVYELDETAYADSVYLRPVSLESKVSQTEAVNGNTPQVKLHSTGIQVTYFEKGKVCCTGIRNSGKSKSFKPGTRRVKNFFFYLLIPSQRAKAVTQNPKTDTEETRGKLGQSRR